MNRSKTLRLAAGALGALVLTTSLALFAAPAAEKIAFTDVEKQTQEFITYYKTIKLNPEQEAIKKQALEAIPAPCCSDNSAYTCCCPCNMAKANWGLANHLVADLGYDAKQVRETISEWVEFINPSGYSGDVCYTPGGCPRPFKHNGCGGMKDTQVSFAE